jgi:hypothetical protein
MPDVHGHGRAGFRITIWHQSGVPARELAERAGHARPSMSVDVYSHVMPPDEIPAERVLALLTDEECPAANRY